MSRRLAVLASWTLVFPAAAQESANVLEAPQVVAGAADRITDVLDLDGDGFADAVGWFYLATGQIRIATWHNDGTGRLEQTHVFERSYVTAPSEPLQSASAVADLNLDGLDDFVIAVGRNVRVWQSSGVGLPVEVDSFAEGSNVTALAIEDFNGDGYPDIAVLAAGVRIHRQSPQLGSFHAWASETSVTQTQRRAMTSADVTGDATPDLVVTQMDQVYVYPVSSAGIGAPTSWTHGTFRFDAHVPFPTAGDIDGDGDVDVVVFGPDSFRVLRRDVTGALVIEDAAPGGPAEFLVDVDGDGDLDGACCGGGGGPPRNTQPSVFQIALNDGTGSFAPAFQLAGLGAEKLAGAVDLDHDGDVDLVAGRCVHYACGPITRPPTPSVLPGDDSDLQLHEAFDIDGDGDLDLRAGVGGMQESRGNGTWAPGPAHVPSAPEGMQWLGDGYPGDFDGDGDLDLVVGMQTEGGVFVSMRLLLNTGGGGFLDAGDAAEPGVDFRPWTSAWIGAAECLVVDLDGDLDLDLVAHAGTGSPFRSRLWLNDGSGSFVFGQELMMVVHAAGNLDGDGLLDLVGVRQANWGVYAALGSAPGAFDPAASLLYGGSVSPWNDQYEVSDIDGDGDLDVAIIWDPGWDTGAIDALYYENDGSGAFTQTVLSTVMARQTARHLVRGIDLDRDGLLDLVMGPVYEAGNSVLVRLQLPGGGWGEPLQYVIDDTPLRSAGVPVDVDGDGDLDLVSDRVIRNRSFEGSTAGHHVQLRGSWSADGMPVTFGGAGPFRVGETAELRLRGAPPGRPGWFRAGYVSGELGGLPLYQITHLFPFTTSGSADDLPGSGEWTLTYQVPGYKRGRTYSYSVWVTTEDGEALLARPEQLRVRYGD